MAFSPVIASESFKPETIPRSANFHPSVWGDYFLSHRSDFQVNEDDIRAHLKLKEEARLMLTVDVDGPIKKLILIDSIQRLGIAYHFETEIDEILGNINSQHHSSGHEDAYADLDSVSLEFRLLRQQGYKISSDVFNQFKDGQGKFKKSLNKNPLGLLSLYEASHLRIKGEEILDEALGFTTAQLQSVAAGSISPTAALQISHALRQPIRRGLPRLEARRYFSIYEHDPSHNDVLFTFAKLDFNILQKLHQKELSTITEWWKELDLPTKLPYIRDRIVECFFWIMGVYFEPEYALARDILTKVIAMDSVLDDTYDAKGTSEELELFTAAVQRWDMAATDNLPDYMKIFYTALINLYKDIEDEMTRQGKLYCSHHAREAMKQQATYFFEESKWVGRKDVPTIEEYLSFSLKTTCYHMLATTSFVGMGKHATEEAFEWLSSYPRVIKASEEICRVMDDIVSSEMEKQREHVATGIECYMKQYGATKEETIHKFNKNVEDAWKDINEACLYPIAIPMPLLTRILNLTRVIDVLYKNKDGYTDSKTSTKKMVSSLLVEPVSI